MAKIDSQHQRYQLLSHHTRPAKGKHALVAYAAKHGEVALDGEGDNSPFVTAFVRHIATPGVEINKLFRLVRDDVLAATGRRQEPFVYGSLPGEDFYFKPPVAAAQ